MNVKDIIVQLTGNKTLNILILVLYRYSKSNKQITISG